MTKMLSHEKFANFKNRKILAHKVPPKYEQQLVQSFFDSKKHGYFVDVGANDPFLDSQSFHLEQLGWKGLLIEPLPQYCELLRKHRTSTVIQCACSSPDNHLKKLELIVAGVHSTLNKTPVAIGAHSEVKIEVLTRTLDSVLEEYKVEPGFDLLSIDVEGHENELFKGLHLAKWKPKLVLLEDHVTSHSKHNFMKSQGYKLLLRTGLNSWYVPQEKPYVMSWSARLEFIRKYWVGLWLRKLRYSRNH